MNLPNKISTFRILLVPIIFILIVVIKPLNSGSFNLSIDIKGSYYSFLLPVTWLIAGVLFLFASFSDWLDGYIARKYDMVTNSGKLLDAIADKILVNAVLIAFLYESIIPVWIVFVLIIRDFCVDALRLVLSTNGKRVLSANKIGKYKTALLMIGLFILFFVNRFTLNCKGNILPEFNFINQLLLIPMYFASILSIYSGIYYFVTNFKLLKS